MLHNLYQLGAWLVYLDYGIYAKYTCDNGTFVHGRTEGELNNALFVGGFRPCAALGGGQERPLSHMPPPGEHKQGFRVFNPDSYPTAFTRSSSTEFRGRAGGAVLCHPPGGAGRRKWVRWATHHPEKQVPTSNWLYRPRPRRFRQQNGSFAHLLRLAQPLSV